MKALHLIGPTGSGKTPLGCVLEERGLYGVRCHHFDFGEELRRVAQGEGPPEITPEEVSFIQKVLSEGLLLENEHFPLAAKIFRGFLTRRRVSPEDLLVLNGLPRHEGQARDMLRLVDIRLLVELTVEEDVLHQRLIRDPAGDRQGRKDDTQELLRRKLHWYRERTQPLKRFFEGRGIRILDLPVKVEDTGEHLYFRLCRLLPERDFKIIFGL